MRDTAGHFRLLLAGNTNVIAMANVISRATVELRANAQDNQARFNPIHIFHTEESLQALTNTTLPWRDALAAYQIAPTSLVHHVTSLQESGADRFDDLVRQLSTIVNPLERATYYVDLTGGVSLLKTILAVFAYVLDLEHVYSLEIAFDPSDRNRQGSMFLPELEKTTARIHYRRFPPIRGFDTFGKRNYTEILRHREIISRAVDRLAIAVNAVNLDYLRDSLLEGVRQRLVADLTNDPAAYRHAVFSSSAGVEEVANHLLLALGGVQMENKTLGKKLEEIRALAKDSSHHFINEKTLEHLTLLLNRIRNDVVHPTPGAEPTTEVLALQASLASGLAMSFLQFAARAISAFVGPSGDLLDLAVIDGSDYDESSLWYFGFDGDSTGDFLADAFVTNAEENVIERSRKVRTVLDDLVRLIRQETGRADAVIFAEGDNILFKAPFRASLLADLQRTYRTQTGLTSSIGYGRSLAEASVAIRLAKAREGDSCVGVQIRNKTSEPPNTPLQPTAAKRGG